MASVGRRFFDEGCRGRASMASFQCVKRLPVDSTRMDRGVGVAGGTVFVWVSAVVVSLWRGFFFVA